MGRKEERKGTGACGLALADVLGRERGRLLAAVMAMAVVLAGAVVVFGDGSVDAASSDETNISGSLPGNGQTYENGAIVNVVGDLTIKENESLTIGQFGTLKIGKDVKMVVNGTLTVDDNARIVVDGTLVVSGGIVKIENVISTNTGYTDAKFEEGFFVNGTMTAERGASVATGDASISINDKGTLNVTSLGVMVSAITGEVDVAPGATFKMNGVAGTLSADKKSVTSGKLVVNACNGTETDSSMNIVVSNAKVEITGDTLTNPTSSKASNLTFTASKNSATAYTAAKVKTTIDTFDLDMAGTIQNGDSILASGVTEITGYKDGTAANSKDVKFKDKVTVSGELKILNGKLTIGSTAYVLISGSSTVVKTMDGSNVMPAFGFEDGGVLEVTGTTSMDYSSYDTPGTSISDAKGKMIINGGTVSIYNCEYNVVPFLSGLHGAYYFVPNDSGKFTAVVCDLEDAISAAHENTQITEAFVNNLDTNTHYVVKESFETPANFILNVNAYMVIPEGMTVTIRGDSAIVLNAYITVEGKLVDETYTLSAADETDGKVDCEVVVDDEENAVKTFTSLAIALSESGEGSVIILAGETTIEKNLTIPTGVTVKLDGKNMTVTNDAALTVDGVLDATTGTLGTTKDSDGPTGTIIVNNYVLVAAGAEYNADSFNVSGIYTSAKIEGIDGTNFIMSMDVFAENSAYTTGAEAQGELTLKGDYTLTAGDGDDTLTIVGEMDVPQITLKGYKISIGENALFTGTISAANGSVSLSSIRASTGETVDIADTIDADEGTDVLSVSGIPAEVDKDGTDEGDTVAKLSVASGTVAVVKDFNTGNLVSFGISEGTTLDVSAKLDVSKFEIAGTVNVLDEGCVNGATIIVLGTLNITDKDATNTTGGQVDATENLYVGTDEKFKTSVAASVSGDGINVTGTTYVVSTATISGDITEGANTQFYVDGALWMTAYGSKATVTDAPVGDARFMGWIVPDTNPEDVLSGDEMKNITIADYERLDAKIDYKIYDVTITVGDGIGSVAIDGQVLAKNSNNTYVLKGLAAGDHEVTFQFKAGYEGTVKMTVDGDAVDGNRFTLSGTEGMDADTNVQVSISLSGATPVDYSNAASSDMGIVEYLLIVLVVVVVILAIFVVLRMMRS